MQLKYTLISRLQRQVDIVYLLIVFVVITIIIGASFSLFFSRQQAEKQVNSQTHNLANSLVLSFNGLIDTIDLTLTVCSEEIANQLAQPHPDKKFIEKYISRQRQLVPSLISLRASDETGNLLYGIEPEQKNSSVADRDYFIEARDHPDTDLYISKPIISRLNNKWIWLFSRRITKQDGTFGGIVTGAILAENIVQMLNKITMPPNSSISVRHKTYELIARADYDRANVIPVGSNVLSNTLINALKKNAEEGTYISDTSGIDKVIKTYSYVASKKYGFIVIAAISREVALAEWYKQVWLVSGLSLLFAIGSLVFGNFIRIAWQQHDVDLKTIQENRDALQLLNSELEQHVQLRTSELSATLDHLRITQNELIQSEKLASLGAMVVGISHEINTPIGNAIMLTSTLEAHINHIRKLLSEGGFSQRELVAQHNSTIEMIQLLDRSVNRVASLVNSFKQLAIDQTKVSRSLFNLKEVVDYSIKDIRSRHSIQSISIENRISDEIICDSFPIPLEQAMTNIIQNAVLHAFEENTPGHVIVNAVVNHEKVEISVSDNGVGMENATVAHIFDPFFTTKLGKGGSGLGLTVTRRIAINILGGDLLVTSTKGAGSQFLLVMLLNAAGKF